MSGAVAIAADPPLAAARALLAASDLPVGDLDDVRRMQFFGVQRDGQLCALVGLEFCGDGDALLRSLCVAADARGHGLGAQLVAHAEAQARARGIGRMYLLTETAHDFFLARGYTDLDREQAPGGVRATREFAGLCPLSAEFMQKQLAPE